MEAILIEGQPLTRLGMQRMLERMPGVGPVGSIDAPADGDSLFGLHRPSTIP